MIFKQIIYTAFRTLAAQLYLKTTVFEHDILSEYWRSEPFVPTLSERFDPIDSTITIPLTNEDNLEHISIKVCAINNKNNFKFMIFFPDDNCDKN
jgi:hypothetical protein